MGVGIHILLLPSAIPDIYSKTQSDHQKQINQTQDKKPVTAVGHHPVVDSSQKKHNQSQNISDQIVFSVSEKTIHTEAQIHQRNQPERNA